MKLKITIAITLLAITFSSCTKCVTCVPYYTNGTVATNTQSVKVCNKTQIEAYENGTNFTDASLNEDTVRFHCN